MGLATSRNASRNIYVVVASTTMANELERSRKLIDKLWIEKSRYLYPFGQPVRKSH